MQVDTIEVIKKLQVHIGTLQYDLITHQVVVDVLERDNRALKQEAEELRLELQRAQHKIEELQPKPK